MRREVVDHDTTGRKFLDGIAVVNSSRVYVERPVAAGVIDVTRRVSGQPAAALPHSTAVPIGGYVVDHRLLQGSGVIAHDPSVIRMVITMRSPGDVDHAVVQQQAWTLTFIEREEGHRASGRAIARSWHASRDRNRAAELLRARRNVKRVQALIVVRTILFRIYDHIHRTGRLVDDRCAGNADLDRNVATLPRITTGNGRDIRAEEADMPQRIVAQSVSVEGIHTVVLGRNIHDVMGA